MKFKLSIIAAVATAVMAFTSTIQAVPLTGNIGFSGSATLNSSDANTATQVVSWGTNAIDSRSGVFVGFVTIGDVVALVSPWNFTSGAVANFWQVDGFAFNLASSSATIGGGFINVVLAGTVSGHGYDPTAFTGSFQVANPSANGATVFTTRLSFASVPDGGTTILLLGAAFSGLALIKRKLVA